MEAMSKKIIVKRQYSRAGCQECKRRKIKCNEARPVCANCQRVNSPCIYPDPNVKNKPRRPRAHADSPASPPYERSMSPLTHFPAAGDAGSKGDLDMLLFENVFDDASTLVHGLADLEQRVVAQDWDGQAMHLKPFHSNIILNDSPKKSSFFEDNELERYLQNTDIMNNPKLAESLNLFNSKNNTFAPQDSPTNSQLIKKITELYNLSPLEVVHLEDFARGQSAMYFYPFASNLDNNEVINVMLEYSVVFKFMLYAMLAVSASCMFTITKKDEHNKNQKRFTTICMRLLVAAFTDLENNSTSLWHIEGLILTVLLLTMLFSDMSFVDTKQAPISWISHLNEARSLLLKYNTLIEKHPNKPLSPGITMAKHLFFSYDWATKMSMQVNDLTKEDLTDLWALAGTSDFVTQYPSPSSSLERLRVMIPAATSSSGFNTFNTLSMEVAEIFFEIMKIVYDSKVGAGSDGDFQASPEAITRIMTLIGQALSHQVIAGVSRETSYSISPDNPAHPLYPVLSRRISLPECAYGKDGSTSLSPYYSWCDVAQRSHVYFLYLRMLTTKGLLYLPRRHPLIRSLVSEVMDLMFFMKPKTDHAYSPAAAFLESENYYMPHGLFDQRAIMIQMPFRLCIGLTDDEKYFEQLELFFRGIVCLGAGNCARSIVKVKQCREASKRRKEHSKLEEADLDYQTEAFHIY